MKQGGMGGENGKSGPHYWWREGSTQCAHQFVTVSPLVCCVVWSKAVQPNGSPCANNHCSSRYEQKAFDTITKSKLAFHKVASFHDLTYTLQTYNHQEHQFRS